MTEERGNLGKWFARSVVLVLGVVAALLLVRELGRQSALDAQEPEFEAASEDIRFLPPADPVEQPESSEAWTPDAPAVECTTVLRARIVDRRGRPIPSASLECAFPLAGARSDRDGRIELPLELRMLSELRRLHLSIRAPGYANVARVEEAGSAALHDLGEIVLEPGGSLRGRVVDATGRPVAQAELRCSTDTEAYGSWRLQGPSRYDATAETDDQGHFELHGVRPGPARVWAGTNASFWTPSEIVTVEAQEAGSEDILLQLRALPPRHVIDVRVVASDGSPVANALVTFRPQSGVVRGAISASTDVDGRCRHVADELVLHTLRADDPSDGRRSALAIDVEPGTGEVELALGPRRPLTIRARNLRLEALPRLTATVIELGEQGRRSDYSSSEGAIELTRPILPFEVEVDAPGCLRTKVGPFDPQRGEDLIDVPLEPALPIRGQVRAGRAPVPGARVSLHRAAPPDSWYVADGLPARSAPDAEASAETDAEGGFELHLDGHGSYWLRAEAEGFAALDAGAFELDGELGAEGLDLELLRGGRIEGRLWVTPGESPADRIVAASRGDGRPRTTRTDGEGRFAFERCTPGRWWVGAHPHEIVPGAWSAAGEAPEQSTAPVFNCDVLDGEVSLFDLSLAGTGPARLHGSLSAPPSSTGGWRASLATLAAPDEDIFATALEADGSFALAAPVEGDYLLRIRCAADGASALTLEAELALRAGPNDWMLDLPLGRAQGRLVSLPVDARVLWRWQRDDTLRASGAVVPDPSGGFVLPRVPAGRVSFYAVRDGGLELLRRVDLPERATLDVEL